MEKQNLTGCSILLGEDEIWDALDFQDSFTETGAWVVTAYRLERAMQLAERTSLSAAIIDLSQGTKVRECTLPALGNTQCLVRFLLQSHAP